MSTEKALEYRGKVCLAGHETGKGSEETLGSLTDGEGSRGRIHRCDVLDIHQLFAKAEVASIKNCPVALKGHILCKNNEKKMAIMTNHVLREQCDRILGSVSFNVRKINIVDKDNHSL